MNIHDTSVRISKGPLNVLDHIHRFMTRHGVRLKSEFTEILLMHHVIRAQTEVEPKYGYIETMIVLAEPEEIAFNDTMTWCRRDDQSVFFGHNMNANGNNDIIVSSNHLATPAIMLSTMQYPISERTIDVVMAPLRELAGDYGMGGKDGICSLMECLKINFKEG